jgi:hypothetical protein
MAVIQISKIQIRRGLKSSGIGVPQLSSAEFAWAIDTQELYIGNGSVAEGAPYVGNTKILTEHDNILELPGSYQFAANDLSITLSVQRSLQTKIDEIQVSVVDFGAVGDGSTDNTQAFNNALRELFSNVNEKFKKVLLVPVGEYLFLGNLLVPSTALIKGETQLGAILNLGANSILFTTEDGQSAGSFTSSNRPKNVSISNITIRHTTGQMVLTGLAESELNGVRFVSDYYLGDSVDSSIFGDSVSGVSNYPASVFWENSLEGTKVTDIKFINCVFESTVLAVRSDQITVDSTNPPIFDTNILFQDCLFDTCDTGILINGVDRQGNRWQINECIFKEIANRAFVSSKGRGTAIQRSKFINCGNDTNTSASPTTEIIYFGENLGNLVKDCFSNRHQFAGFTTNDLTSAVTEVFNSSKTSLVDMNHADIFLSDSFRPLAVFSALNNYTYIDYTLKLGSFSRVGQLVICVDDIRRADSTNTPVSFADNFHYSASRVTDSGGDVMTNFQFTVDLQDNSIINGNETIVLKYVNPLASGLEGTISYSITYGV